MPSDIMSDLIQETLAFVHRESKTTSRHMANCLGIKRTTASMRLHAAWHAGVLTRRRLVNRRFGGNEFEYTCHTDYDPGRRSGEEANDGW